MPDISRNILYIITRCTAVTAITLTIIGTDVVLTSAGTLTPPGPPVATMRTLEQIKPTWDKIIPAAQRFVDALDGTAVLDKETGLVWEKTPDATLRTWQDSMVHCSSLYLGGRMGWRLPTLEELASLVDKSNPGTIKLPAGHPFQNATPGNYWSSSGYIDNVAYAWAVSLISGGVLGGMKTGNCYTWAVRGGP